MRALRMNAAGLAALLAPLAVLTLGGCLLPQPDTPPIGPPNVMSGRVGAPQVSAPQADTALTTPAPSDAPSAAASAAPPPASSQPGSAGAVAARSATLLEGRVVGAIATRVAAVAEAAGQPGALVAPDADGRFALPLAPGRYTLELTVAGGVIVAMPVVEVTADGPNRVQVTVSEGAAAVTATE